MSIISFERNGSYDNAALNLKKFLSIKIPGKISAQPHTTLCIQFLDRAKNDKNNTLPLGKQICLTIVWGCAQILPSKALTEGNLRRT